MSNNKDCENHFIFPSPVHEFKCDDYIKIRESLIQWIYLYKDTVEGVGYSNRGGWQSPHNVHEEASFSPYIGYILNKLSPCLECYDIDFRLSNMWININPKGAYNQSHSHSGSILSGVFWVQIPDDCGDLIFENSNYFGQDVLIQNMHPAFKEHFNYNNTHAIKPKEGTLLVFPANLRHFVEENQSETDRISIAFNISLL